MAVLRRPADFTDLANAYLTRAARDGVRHVEMFFDPQAHISRGVPLSDVLAGLGQAIREAPTRHGVSVLLIACFLRDRPVTEAMATLGELAGHLDVVHGVGLDSAEVGHPPSAFEEVFAAAESLGLKKVAHAGEEGPPQYVWEALDVLGVERIDHGIRAVEDDGLIRRLAADRIPLTVCPLSNLRLQCVRSLQEHPLPQLLEAGVVVTINSDDPAYFGGYVADNYLAIHRELGVDIATLRQLAQNSLDACFSRPLTSAPPPRDAVGSASVPAPRGEPSVASAALASP
jgi:adenosine deaminase